MRKYSYPQELYTVFGKKIHFLPQESRGQYWDRIKELQCREEYLMELVHRFQEESES